MTSTPNAIDAYIATFPAEVQSRLQQIRAAIRSLVPEADEVIKYAIPTYVFAGVNLVHFAGYQHHIGFYPIPSSMKAFEKELSPYKKGKGSVQFPLDQPLPLTLIKKIVAFRLKEVLDQQQSKKKKGKEAPKSQQ